MAKLLAEVVNRRDLPDPPAIRFVFGNTATAPVWMLLRLYVGWQWLQAGLAKIHDPAWSDGSAIEAFWRSAVAAPQQGQATTAYGWYRDLIQFMLDNGWYAWFGPVVTWGEFLVGLGLIVGGLTGFAAFFGAMMNFNFMLAGSASANPVLFLLAILLLLAWKVSGHIGVDRWLLPALGTPWEPGTRTSRRGARSRAMTA